MTEQSPVRRGGGHPHVFAGLATRLAEWDPLLTALLPREVLEAIVAAVPESFLTPLLDPASAHSDALARRRAAYVAFLWKRLQGPRETLPA